MEEYYAEELDEEFNEMTYNFYEQTEADKINFQNRELLEITEKGYRDEEEEDDEDVVLVNMTASSVEKFLQIIDQAEREAWENLSVEVNDFQEIPAEIGRLINLKSLYIESNGNRIILPPEIGNLKRLEEFDAYGCNMEALPERFGELTNLKSINLNHNSFPVFPKEILRLEKLESLAIDSDFQVLPDEICNLARLKRLYLPGANISRLPDDIGNLQELEVLCIWGTKVSRLPDSCRKLKKIKSLYLTKSVFMKILPPEIISQSPLEVINYIIRYQNDSQKREVNESKMIIVGQGGVGKTCLLNRLINDEYDETVSTEGIAIEPWEFSMEGKQYKLNTWDFGGQEIYHATHQFFLTNRSLYIFVWDVRQEEEYGRIDYWLHTIESFAYHSPIIIVVNKCDSRNSAKQLDLKSIRERFPQVIDCFTVSCKTNLGIQHFRNAVQEETTKLPLMGMVWLSSWLDVRMELESLARNTNMIPYSKYQEICRKYHILSGEALSLSKYLHDLGIIINFQKDVYLKNIVILNPEWATKAVYKVLDSQGTVLKNRNGILYYDDLPEIWKDTSEYPEEIYPIILRLMENFQLSFEVNKNREYLIAELLENEEILRDFGTDNGQTLNFQYNYEFLPAGIMTRFIVKANAYLVEQDGKKACWKKGAYLRYENSTGFIKLFDGIAERRIEIKVTGRNNRNNRDLLTIIRKYFGEIHGSVPKIKYKEYVRCNCEEYCAYLHDYRYLLRLEAEKIETERCKNSLKEVNVRKLLDGVEDTGTRSKMRRESMPNIQVNPQIVIENNNSNSSANSNANSVAIAITIDIKNCINELQGSLNDLKDEMMYDDPELGKEFERMEKSIEKLDNAETRDEVIKSGALNKVQRFLADAQDPDSKLGKAVRGIRYGVKIAQDIAEKYNSIAEWCGLPVVPKVFLRG